MRIIRFLEGNTPVLAAINDDSTIYKLPQSDFIGLMRDAKKKNLEILQLVEDIISVTQPLKIEYDYLSLLTPVDAPEILEC